MTRLTLLFLLIFSTAIAQKEKKTNIFTNAGDAAKMMLAKQKLYAGDYVDALNLFREVEINNPNDAGVKYYVASSYFNLKQFDKAKGSLVKAIEINKDIVPETYLLMGRLSQMEEDFEKAIQHFETYKACPGNEASLVEDANLFQSQCLNAKRLMATPNDVTVINLGPGINSQYDDKNPCITADGRKLVFTTRRPETTNDAMDIEGDGKYFENIYFSELDTVSGAFKLAFNAGNTVNTKAHDACTGISPDGKQIFIYKNDLNDRASRGGNIFVSKVAGGKWKKPEVLDKPLNSSYWEGGACVSADNKRYFFSSERPGGYGSSDIWMVEKISKTKWGQPVNLGPLVNTSRDEAAMFLAPDGITLFFCSNGPKSMGGYDVLKTVYENGSWTEPVNLGYPINSVAKEGQLSISADARYAYFSSDRKGGFGESDLYMVDLKDYAILEKEGKRQRGNQLSILKGTIREGFEGYGIADVEITLTDGAGKTIARTSTNENGEYFLTLHGGKYNILINKKGYAKISEEIEVVTDEKGTAILEKGYLLKK